MAETELVNRIITAFRSFRAFVFQKDLDEPSKVFSILRSAKLTAIVEVRSLPHGIYVVTINTRPCQVECRLKKCKDVGEEEKEKCVSKCMEDCISKLNGKIVEALKSYIEK